LILEKAQRPEDIPEATLDIRQKLQPIRQVFREIEYLMIHGTKTECDQAFSSLKEFHRILSARTTYHLEVVAAGVLTDAALAAAAVAANPIGIFSLLRKLPLLRQVFNRAWQNRRVLYVQGLIHRYWKLDDMAALIHKVWGADVNTSEISRLWARFDALPFHGSLWRGSVVNREN
jgi:hypothetical protein